MEFNCNQCNYASHDKFNYDRHLKSKKHKEKEIENTKISQIYHKDISNDSPLFKCLFCQMTFTKSCNLARHKNGCKTKQNFIDDFLIKENEYKNQLKNMETQLIFSKESFKKEIENKNEIINCRDNIIKEKDDMISTLRSENRNLRTLLNNAGSVIKTSVSTLSYLVKNYTEAPALEPIQDLPKLHFELSSIEFTEQLIHEYRHQTLTSYIGDIILKQYKKEDPTQQSIWNSDTNRLTYIIREIMHNKNLDWRVDKKGLKTSKYIIEPALDYIGECLEEYLQKTKIGKRSDSANLIVNVMNNFNDVNKIIQMIEDKILEEEILKYIAPHLYLIKDDILIES